MEKEAFASALYPFLHFAPSCPSLLSSPGKFYVLAFKHYVDAVDSNISPGYKLDSARDFTTLGELINEVFYVKSVCSCTWCKSLHGYEILFRWHSAVGGECLDHCRYTDKKQI